MKKWHVILSVDATVDISVEAETKEEAERLAFETAPNPSVCHQCSRQIDIGDILDIVDCEEIQDV